MKAIPFIPKCCIIKVEAIDSVMLAVPNTLLAAIAISYSRLRTGGPEFAKRPTLAEILF
jgi:hypothetical protein